jgi:protoheme IX farnesyltransferase
MRKNRIAAIIDAYTDLIRYRLSLAVTMSSVTGYFIFQNTIEFNFLLMISGVFILASGASVLNQYTEINYDSLMGRTRLRPLPQEKINKRTALWFAGSLFCSGSICLLIIGIIPGFLGLLNVLLYNYVYTGLKRVTPLAIIPGALAGAIPPLIGFEAAGSGMPGTEIIMFSSFMFLWQLPHFWLILLKYHKEYETAGFITIFQFMKEAQIRILIFVWVLFSTSLLLLFSVAGIVFNKVFLFFIIPLNFIFIVSFYYQLFGNIEKKEFRGALKLVNIFSLLVMILFIVNSFLS